MLGGPAQLGLFEARIFLMVSENVFLKQKPVQNRTTTSIRAEILKGLRFLLPAPPTPSDDAKRIQNVLGYIVDQVGGVLVREEPTQQRAG